MVYLIHFAEPYKHARHYIGFTESKKTLSARMEHHRNGQGSRLMRAVTVAGIAWHVVRIWAEGDRTFERSLKERKEAPKLCPICSNGKPKMKGSGICLEVAR